MRARPLLAIAIAATATASLAGCALPAAAVLAASAGDPTPTTETDVSARDAEPGTYLPDEVPVSPAVKADDRPVVVPRSAVTMDSYAPGSEQLPPPPPETGRDDAVGATAAAAYFMVSVIPFYEWGGDATALGAMCPSCAATLDDSSRPQVTDTSITLPREWTSATAHRTPEGFAVDLQLDPKTLLVNPGVPNQELRMTTDGGTHRVAMTRSSQGWQVLEYGAPPANPRAIPEPTPPPEVQREDGAGAAAAAVYFWEDVMDYTILSGDTTYLDEMDLLRFCTGCQAIRSQIELQHAARIHSVPGRSSTQVVDTYIDDDGSYTVVLDYSQEGDEIRTDDDELVDVLADYSGAVTLTLIPLGGGSWVVVDLGATRYTR